MTLLSADLDSTFPFRALQGFRGRQGWDPQNTPYFMPNQPFMSGKPSRAKSSFPFSIVSAITCQASTRYSINRQNNNWSLKIKKILENSRNCSLGPGFSDLTRRPLCCLLVRIGRFFLVFRLQFSAHRLITVDSEHIGPICAQACSERSFWW